MFVTVNIDILCKYAWLHGPLDRACLDSLCRRSLEQMIIMTLSHGRKARPFRGQNNHRFREVRWFILHKGLRCSDDHLAEMSSKWPSLVFFFSLPFFFFFLIIVWLLVYVWSNGINISGLLDYLDYFALFCFLFFSKMIWTSNGKLLRPERILVLRCWTHCGIFSSTLTSHPLTWLSYKTTIHTLVSSINTK